MTSALQNGKVTIVCYFETHKAGDNLSQPQQEINTTSQS
jgi:hypothetical protein